MRLENVAAQPEKRPRLDEWLVVTATVRSQTAGRPYPTGTVQFFVDGVPRIGFNTPSLLGIFALVLAVVIFLPEGVWPPLARALGLERKAKR